MKYIKFILILIISLFVGITSCFGQSKGEIVAKNGIYAMVDINPKDNWMMRSFMFVQEGDTIHISMDNIDSTIRSILKDGELVAPSPMKTLVKVFNCTLQQGYDSFFNMNAELSNNEKKEKKKWIIGDMYQVSIDYIQIQAFFLKTTKEEYGGDPVNSISIPPQYAPDEFLVLLGIVNLDEPDEINIEIVN